MADEEPDVSNKLVQVTHEIGRILDCGLTQEQTRLLLLLLKNGEHPEALAKVVKTLQNPRDKSRWDE
eukprot:jgi/Ulvmu1/6584/UM003_0221.1